MITLFRCGASYYNDTGASQFAFSINMPSGTYLSLFVADKETITIMDIVEWLRLQGIIVDFNHESGLICFTNTTGVQNFNYNTFVLEIQKWFGLKDDINRTSGEPEWLSDNFGSSRIVVERLSIGIYAQKSFIGRKREKGVLSVTGKAFNQIRAISPSINQLKIDGYDEDDFRSAIDFIENCSNDDCVALGLETEYPIVKVMGEQAYLADSYTENAGQLMVKVADYKDETSLTIRKLGSTTYSGHLLFKYISICYVTDSSAHLVVAGGYSTSLTSRYNRFLYFNESLNYLETDLGTQGKIIESQHIGDDSCFIGLERSSRITYATDHYEKDLILNIVDGTIIGGDDTFYIVAYALSDGSFSLYRYETATTPTHTQGTFLSKRLMKGSYLKDGDAYFSFFEDNTYLGVIYKVDSSDVSYAGYVEIDKPLQFDKSVNGTNGVASAQSPVSTNITDISLMDGDFSTHVVSSYDFCTERFENDHKIQKIDDYNFIVAEYSNDAISLYHVMRSGRNSSRILIDEILSVDGLVDYDMTYVNESYSTTLYLCILDENGKTYISQYWVGAK